MTAQGKGGWTPGPVKLSEREATCLRSVYERASGEQGYGVYFRAVVEDTGFTLDQVRRSVRACARKGLTEHVRGLFDEDGRVAGSGYGLTPAGISYSRAAISLARGEPKTGEGG